MRCSLYGLLTQTGQTEARPGLFGLRQMGRAPLNMGNWWGQGRAKLFTTPLINAPRNTPKVPAIKPNKVPNLMFSGENHFTGVHYTKSTPVLSAKTSCIFRSSLIAWSGHEQWNEVTLQVVWHTAFSMRSSRDKRRTVWGVWHQASSAMLWLEENMGKVRTHWHRYSITLWPLRCLEGLWGLPQENQKDERQSIL